MSQALQAVSDEFDAPLAGEFAYCFEQQNLGLPPSWQLRRSGPAHRDCWRSRSSSWPCSSSSRPAATSWNSLDKLSGVIREPLGQGPLGKVRALTAEGRVQAVVLLSLPPAVFLMMLFLNRSYAQVLLDRPGLLVGVLVTETLGALWIPQDRQFRSIKVRSRFRRRSQSAAPGEGMPATPGVIEDGQTMPDNSTLTWAIFLSVSTLVLLIFTLLGGRKSRLTTRNCRTCPASRTRWTRWTLRDAVKLLTRSALPTMGKTLIPTDDDKRTQLQTRLIHAGLYSPRGHGRLPRREDAAHRLPDLYRPCAPAFWGW